MTNIRIGLFSPLNTDLTIYMNRLQVLGDVNLITVNQKLGAIDLLVYPDGMGILPDTSGLKHGDRYFIPSFSINPYFYLFWNDKPFQNIIEERNIPVLGVGHAAGMIYSELGGKIFINYDNNLELLRPDNKLSQEGIIFSEAPEYGQIFAHNGAFGATKLDGISHLIGLIRDYIQTVDTTDNYELPDDNISPIVPNTPFLAPSARKTLL